MYKLIGADGLGNYAVYDTETDFTEAISDTDLKLCLNVGLSVAGAYLNENGDVEYTEDYFPKEMEFEDEDDDYDWEDEEEDVEDSDTDDEDEEEDEYYWDADEEDEDSGDVDEDDDYYEDFEDDTEIITRQEDSAMSKLFSRLTDEQIAVMQEYYLYISQRIFDLQTGNAKLNVRKSKDLDELRDTGGTWHYAGFMDMGYSGSSVCPSCRASMSAHSVSGCCNAPIITYRSKDKSQLRTFNGSCSCCGSRCSAVTRKVALRDINRSNQQGVVCEVCNSELEQSSHYCTFNHPVRFMHIAWDVSKTDIEVGLFGQLATQKLEDIIDSNNCIKFGLECIADFFDIPRDSEAFKALKDVQDTCISDMKNLEKTYTAYESDLSQVTDTFAFTDEIVHLIGTYNAKAVFAKKEPIMPDRLIICYKKMRQLNMIPPKSLIQYIRDYFIGWTDHKFSDGCKKYPFLKFSVGCIQGADIDTRNATHHITLAENLRKIFGRGSDELCKFIKENMEKNYKLVNSTWSPYRSSKTSAIESTVGYLTSAFIYEVCGFYKYNALPSSEPNSSTDEGGASRDLEGKHIKELSIFNRCIERRFFKDSIYTVGYLRNLMSLYVLASECSKFLEDYKSDSLFYNYDTELYERKNEYKLNKQVIEKYSEINGLNDSLYNALQLANAFVSYNNNITSCVLFFDRSYSNLTLEDAISLVEGYKSIIEGNIEQFKVFREDNLDKAIQYKNKKLLEEKEEKVKVEGKAKAEEKVSNKMGSGKDVVDFLKSRDLSGVSEKFDFAKKLVEQLSKSGKEPSSKQLYYINALYREVTGSAPELAQSETQSEEPTKLDDRQDIEKAIDYCLEHKDKLDSERTASILTSIKRYRKISVRQMKYAEMALSVYNENK